jgi:hypothetical protein
VRTRILSHVAALLLAGAAAGAEPPPTGIPDLVGPRSLALGASVGIAANNEGILVNPAAIGTRRRYSVETLGILDRRGADTTGGWLGGSVVDSISSPMTAGFAYLRAQKGAFTGNAWTLALSGPIAERFHLGVAGKAFSLHGDKKVTAVTFDAGIFWQVADLLSVGAAGYNLVPIATDAVAPRGVGAGLAVGSDQVAQVTADWHADFDRLGKTSNRYAAGAEVLLGKLIAVRAGYTRDEVLDTTWWSAGLGLASRSGVSLDLGYRQSVDDTSARTLAASLKLFMFN